jgi:hypothetical protein
VDRDRKEGGIVMRATLICLAAGSVFLVACSKKAAETPAAPAASATAAAPTAAAPTPGSAVKATGAPVSGTFKAVGKPAALTEVKAYKGEPESGKPVTVLVFSSKDQGADAKAPEDALFNKFGDALVVKLFADGSVYSVDVVHSALDAPGGSAQLFGVVKMTDFANSGGQISGHISTGGDTDIHGQSVNIDLSFHTQAP